MKAVSVDEHVDAGDGLRQIQRSGSPWRNRLCQPGQMLVAAGRGELVHLGLGDLVHSSPERKVTPLILPGVGLDSGSRGWKGRNTPTLTPLSSSEHFYFASSGLCRCT